MNSDLSSRQPSETNRNAASGPAGSRSVTGSSIARSAARLLLGQGTLFLVQSASVVVLARLITPEVFGIMAMALAFVGIGHLLRDIGLSNAAIQAKSLSVQQRSNLFWINSGVGLVLAVLALVAAVPIAWFYSEPQVATVVVLLSPTLLFSGMATQYRASLVRDLRMGAVAFIDVVCAIVGLGAAVLAAIGGLGVISLALQQLVPGVLSLILSVSVASWLPRRYDRRASMDGLLKFGASLFGSQGLTYVAFNLETALIGVLFGARPTGLYNRAVQVVRVPLNQMRSPLGTLALSVLSRLQGDHDRFIAYILRGHLLMGYPVLFFSGMLVALADQVVLVVLGPDWLEVVPYLRLIAVGEGLATLATVGYWIYASRGLGAALFRFTLFSLMVKAVLVLGGCAFGPIGIAVAFAVSQAVLWPISLWWVGRVADIDTRGLIWNSWRIIGVVGGASLVAFAVACLTAGFPTIATCLISIGASFVSIAAFVAVPRVRLDYFEMYSTFRSALLSKGGKA